MLYHRLKIEDGKNPKCCRRRKAPAGTTFTRLNRTKNSVFRKIFLLNESQVIFVICSVCFVRIQELLEAEKTTFLP